MNIFDNIQKLTHAHAHGEINFYRIVEGDVDVSGFTPFTDKNAAGEFVVGHSESGHNHVLESGGVEILERNHEGMKILYAILNNPVALKQEAGSPHKTQIVQPGTYIIGSSLDYDPFTQQARRVAD